MQILDPIPRRWSGATCVVAASGPSLSQAQAALCEGVPTIVVNDAHRLFPWADVLYACDEKWWFRYDGVTYFRGERITSHGVRIDDKLHCAERWGLTIVRGRTAPGFSTDPHVIHYGQNSGFQAINLAVLFGARRIVLVGFDMRNVGNKRHFFGDHPRELRNADPSIFIKHYDKAASTLPDSVEIVNATPDSALKCFPVMDLRDALLRPCAP